jgi:hypothetical protein
MVWCIFARLNSPETQTLVGIMLLRLLSGSLFELVHNKFGFFQLSLL